MDKTEHNLWNNQTRACKRYLVRKRLESKQRRYCSEVLGIKYISRNEAIGANLKEYFTGIPCKHNHVSARYVSTNQCKVCVVTSRKNTTCKLRTHKFPDTKPAKYSTYKHRLLGTNCRTLTKNILEVSCHKCKTWFIPMRKDVVQRVRAVEGKASSAGAQSHLYCSDKCKEDCATFWTRSTPKTLHSTTKQSRCADTRNKKVLMELQLDKVGYNYCEKCGVKTDILDIHHTIMLKDNHKEGTNPAHQILLCREKCHKEPIAHCR